MGRVSFYSLRSRGLVCISCSLILLLPTIPVLLHSSQTAPAPGLCPSPVVPSSAHLDTSHLLEPLLLEEEDQAWAGRLPPGGTFSPATCLATTRLAVLVPYRDRAAHLATFLRTMHPFLQAQAIHYTILVLNQTGEAPFMRGLLFNAGVAEAGRVLSPPPDCFVLHDVDHIPERHGLLYRCSPHGVFHLAAAVDRFDYQLFMAEYTGGVSAITAQQYTKVNGFSNMYLGWGCEDEDFYTRVVAAGLGLVRVGLEISRYRTLPHLPNYPNWFWDQAISALDRARFPNLQQVVDPDGTNTDRYDYNKFLQAGAHTRIGRDGLASVSGYYTLEGVERRHAYTSLLIRPRHNEVLAQGLKYIEETEQGSL